MRFQFDWFDYFFQVILGLINIVYDRIQYPGTPPSRIQAFRL